MTPHRTARLRRLPKAHAASLAVLLVGIGGLAAASAATLSVDASGRDSVAAGSADLVSCDASVTATLGGYAWDAANGRFTANRVVVSDVASACTGRAVAVAVVSASGTVIGVGDATVSGTQTPVTITTLTNPTAAADIHVVIS
ncbi:hypothetical protein [Cellulomonas alba]|uniref:Uncharacterized protein n=1 Tax=Cellulomonas alba TaxID=3053467 RepID=A0ABT7SGV5_9CELL|nr:hypothetical protein [Cellulomonas alba]MDM7855428.1 hypothetical protein [Cellulomonas alba]